MNKKLLILSLIVLSMLLCIPLASALEPVTAFPDKSKYAPGEKGTMYVDFYNDRDVAVELKNITLTYTSWNAYIGGNWVGNETRTVSIPISSRGIYVFSDLTFTVPTDGRAVSTSVSIRIGTDHGYEYGYGYINVPETPRYMDQVITLFTTQVVLLIVCTIIIAATIFLSTRRPQITWRKEEKAE